MLDFCHFLIINVMRQNLPFLNTLLVWNIDKPFKFEYFVCFIFHCDKSQMRSMFSESKTLKDNLNFASSCSNIFINDKKM